MLIAASELGFKESVGVEFASELVDVSRNNIKTLGIKNATVWLGDAANFEFPPGNLVVYLFNPFTLQILRSVLRNLKATRFASLYVIYRVPVFSEELDEAGFLFKMGSPLGWAGKTGVHIWISFKENLVEFSNSIPPAFTANWIDFAAGSEDTLQISATIRAQAPLPKNSFACAFQFESPPTQEALRGTGIVFSHRVGFFDYFPGPMKITGADEDILSLCLTTRLPRGAKLMRIGIAQCNTEPAVVQNFRAQKLCPERDQHPYRSWNTSHFVFDSLQSFLASSFVYDGISTIRTGSNNLDFYFVSKQSKCLVIFFHGAVNRTVVTEPPAFVGQGVAGEGSYSYLMVSDPALSYDPDIGLGWFSGGSDLPLQRIMAPILSKFAQCAGAEKVILFGGSAGGFASLLYAPLLKNALPVPLNPQTIISKYDRQQVERYARTCFAYDGKRNIQDFLSSHIIEDIANYYSENTKMPFLYLQNKDDWHVKAHAMPFVEALGATDKSANCRYLQNGLMLFGWWGSGHIPPSKRALSALLNFLATRTGSWSECLRDPALFSNLADIQLEPFAEASFQL